MNSASPLYMMNLHIAAMEIEGQQMDERLLLATEVVDVAVIDDTRPCRTQKML
jgi:hypothetical protein